MTAPSPQCQPSIAAISRLKEFAAGKDCFRSRAEPTLREDIVSVCNSHASLKARIQELEGALQPLAEIPLWRDTYPDAKDDTLVQRQLQGYVTVASIRTARAALAGETR